MFSAAVNPLVWWGLGLISVPIIIHLINRFRYKRVRWAAMEFLLKAEQRNRRKLIIEQLLLLLVRCAIVAAIVALIARPTWFLGDTGLTAEGTNHHVILLDDTLSTRDLADANSPEGATAFRAATKLLTDLAGAHQEAAGTHYWTLLRFTDPSQPEVGKPLPADTPTEGAAPLGIQLTADEAAKLKDRLESLRPSFLPATPLPAVQQAARYLQRAKDGRTFLHIVSDFRKIDWLEGPAEELQQLLAELARLKVRVKLHDVARPARSPNVSETPAGHENLGLSRVLVKARRRGDQTAAGNVSDEQPLRQVTPRLPFEVQALVKNFSSVERRAVRIVVSINGVEKGSREIDRLPGGGETAILFNLEFAPEEAVGLKAIAVRLDDPELRDHLPADNLRFGFVELVRDVPVLLVEAPRPTEQLGDGFFVNAALTASSRVGLRVQRATPRELSRRQDLANFPVIWLLDIAGVGKGEADLEPEGLAALEAYVKNGGCLIFSLGPRTNVVSFNEQLHRQGQGLFPAPLMARPDPEGRSTLPFIDEVPDEKDLSAKVRFEQPGHPLLPFEGEVVDLLSRYLNINRYFRVDPAWQPPPGTQVLLRLANRRPLSLYADEAKSLADALDGQKSRYIMVAKHVTELREAIADAAERKNNKGPLLDALTGLKNDAALADLWKTNAELKGRVDKLLARVGEGDPLLLQVPVTGATDRTGQVIVLVSPLAPTPIRGREYGWNNLASGDLGEFFFVPLMLSLQTHLASQSQIQGDRDLSRLVGETYTLKVPRDRYQPEVEVWFQPDDRTAPTRVNVLTAEAASVPSVAGPPTQLWQTKIAAVRGPGLYRLRLNQPKSDGAAPTSGEISIDTNVATAKAPPEERPLAFNVDNRREGELARFAEGDLRERLVVGLSQGPAKLAASDAQSFVDSKNWFTLSPLGADAPDVVKTNSWSDLSWILFAFLGLLLFEQFLARRFSHLSA